MDISIDQQIRNRVEHFSDDAETEARLVQTIQGIRWWRGGYFHYAVLVTYLNDDRWIYEITGEPLSEKATVPFRERRCGGVIDFEVWGTVPETDITAAVQRLLAVESIWNANTAHSSPYNLIDAQCEHVARFIVTNQWYSEQTTLGLLIGGGCALFFPKETFQLALALWELFKPKSPNQVMIEL